ncbi:hypothetical protein B005_4377 [Nocardiopsis alba ATCC BAA-2165]|uniref:Uncharacterized protein n=1 Tax=Nocardiopsis alba (strain ATCC BAA-2165 / BE74) TaxID=1205910 RepID=J7L8L4_NOCAA|nr:hypothetical protein B005_4377 [Nocardiopsis alba ATCC BAA-2165]
MGVACRSASAIPAPRARGDDPIADQNLKYTGVLLPAHAGMTPVSLGV